MELSQLTYFLTVAQMQHMTRAAEALHIAQPALTKSVQRLESELGVPLIARKGRGIALTPYGQRLAVKPVVAVHPVRIHQQVIRRMRRVADAGEQCHCKMHIRRRFREQCSQLCQQSGFMPQYAYECTGPSTVRNLISLGCGVGFWPEYTMNEARLAETSGALFRCEQLKFILQCRAEFLRQWANVAAGIAAQDNSPDAALCSIHVAIPCCRSSGRTE